MTAFFVTGTDTGVGKTLVAAALLRLLQRRGLVAVGMKPVAAGFDAAGRNEDVDALMAASSIRPLVATVNPYPLRQPIAPHLAAAAEGTDIRFATIHSAFAALTGQAEAVVVEGVGGFRVPLGPDGDSADLARWLALPVILVVGLRLGCLNHALLTQEAMASRGLTLAGWIANRIDPAMACADANIDSLSELILAPRLGILPFMTAPTAEQAADFLRLPD